MKLRKSALNTQQSSFHSVGERQAGTDQRRCSWLNRFDPDPLNTQGWNVQGIKRGSKAGGWRILDRKAGRKDDGSAQRVAGLNADWRVAIVDF